MTLDEAREITRIDPNAVGWLSDDEGNIIKIVYRERKEKSRE